MRKLLELWHQKSSYPVLIPEMATKLALSFGTFISGEEAVVVAILKHSEMLYCCDFRLLSAGCSVTAGSHCYPPAVGCRRWNQ